MQRGVDVDGELLKFDRVVAAGGDGANRWFDCTLHTGRNREVRRLWEAHGFAVSRLMRTSYGPLGLPREVRPGAWFEVTGDALIRLYEAVALASPSQPRELLSGERLQTKRGRRTAPEPATGDGTGAPRRKQRAQDRTARVEYVPPGERRPRGRPASGGGRSASPDDARPTTGRRGPRTGRDRDAPAMPGERPRRGRTHEAATARGAGNFRGSSPGPRREAFQPGTDRPRRPSRDGQEAQSFAPGERPPRRHADAPTQRPPREGQRGHAREQQALARPWTGNRSRPQSPDGRSASPRGGGEQGGPWGRASARAGSASPRAGRSEEGTRPKPDRAGGRWSPGGGAGRPRTPGSAARAGRGGDENRPQRPWDARSTGGERRTGRGASDRPAGPYRGDGGRGAAVPARGPRKPSDPGRPGPRGPDKAGPRGHGGARGPARSDGQRPPGRPRGGAPRRPN